MKLDRRRFLGASAGVTATVGMTAEWAWPKYFVSYRRPRSTVAVLNADEYSEKIEVLLLDGLRLFRLKVLGRSILLKPNLVEDLPGPVNTNSALIGAAARCFLRLGAARIVIGEGPGHQRDTELVVQAAGLKPHFAERQIEFVDLNRDELRKVKLKANYSGLGELWLPRSVLDADFVVSMPKVKTHHWAGVTLSLKNMFGIVPGMKYGWPKNLLHCSGIHESILDICATVPIHFVIADGITAMEGNGPLQGSARQLGKIVLADDPVAVDATCARLMGFDPQRVRHLSAGCHFLGNLREDRITMLAEGVGAPIPLGTALLREIDKGLAKSRIGIVLVTPALLQRLKGESIADKELSVLLARNQLVPIVHGTTYEALRDVSPMLASRTGLSTAENPMADVAAKLAELITLSV